MDSFYTVANYGKDMVVGFSQNGSVCGKIVGGSSEDVRIWEERSRRPVPGRLVSNICDIFVTSSFLSCITEHLTTAGGE